MMKFFSSLLLMPKTFRDTLLGSAEDPREVYGTEYPRQQGRAQEVDREVLPEALESGFSGVNSEVGLRIVRELVHEYTQLQPVLSRRKVSDPLSVSHIPPLALATYRQGLSILEDALELSRAIHSPDVEKLEEELARLKEEIESLRFGGSQAARIKMREETAEAYRELLEVIKQQQLRVDELLHQSDRCQASLHRTRIELAALRAGRSRGSVSTVTETLRRTIDQARGVQEEMKRLGF